MFIPDLILLAIAFTVVCIIFAFGTFIGPGYCEIPEYDQEENEDSL